MDQYKAQLNRALHFFKNAKKQYTEELKQYPDGKLICSLDRGRNQFYIAKKQGNDYIRKGLNNKPGKIKELARKEFLIRILKEIDVNITVLERSMKSIHEIDPEKIIESMSKAYRSLPTDYFFDKKLDEIINNNDEIVSARINSHKKWGSEPYEISLYKPEEKDKLTSHGVPMRSKAEVMVAEKLYEYNIPFRYEQVVHLGQYELAPDFTFEDSCNEEFYLEYCGMMGDVDYTNRHIWKRNVYEAHGICPWKNIYYIYDQDNRINMVTIDSLIRNEIIPRL